MKELFSPILVGLALCCSCRTATAQEFKEHLSKEFTLSGPATSQVVAIYNIEGSIKVEGYSGNKVTMEIDKTISAKDDSTLEIGKKEFRMEFEQTGDSVIAYIAEPYDSRPHTWQRDFHQKKIRYRYNLSFTVKVPFDMNLAVQTINNGSVTVKDVAGTLSVHNVNGPITIINAKGTTDANTVNGNLTVNYLAVPPGDSKYYTLNGTLEVTYPASLSADLQFKSMNGAFYTDFPNVEAMPPRITTNKENTGHGTIYKLNKDSDLRVGAGGKIFHFETLNGNVYIKKQS